MRKHDRLTIGIFFIVAVVTFCFAMPAFAEPDLDLGVEVGQGLSSGSGMFTWSSSTLETTGDPEPPFDLLPFMVENISLLDASGRNLYHSIETFFHLGNDTDSYLFSAFFMDDNVGARFYEYQHGIEGDWDYEDFDVKWEGKKFNGFGITWILPIIWKETDDEDTETKHKTIRLGLYSDGNSDWLAKLSGKYSVYRGENYMLKFNIIYDDGQVRVIQGVFDHPTSPGGDLHIQAGYWRGLYGVMMMKDL